MLISSSNSNGRSSSNSNGSSTSSSNYEPATRISPPSTGLMFALLGVGLIISEFLALVFYLNTRDLGAIPMAVLPVVFFIIVVIVKVYDTPLRVRHAILDGQTEFR
jgi:hypothetical protein